MPLGNPDIGFGNSAELQSSAIPWVTSSVAPSNASGPVQLDLPMVSRFIHLTNHGPGYLGIGFTANGMKQPQSNRILVAPSGSYTVELRVKRLFIQGEQTSTPTYSLTVGLTTIKASNMQQLSGTLDDGTAGWQGVG